MSRERMTPARRILCGLFIINIDVFARLALGQKLTAVPPEYGYAATNNVDGVGNFVVQTYQFYAPPKKPTISTATQAPVVNGANNPNCLNKEKHYAYSVTVPDIKDPARTYGVFVPDTHEIFPVMLVTLDMDQPIGTVSVKGAGIRAEAIVNRANVIRTVCGKWVFSKTGYYNFEFPVLTGASARIMYFVRRRQTPDEAVLLEYPIDVEMNVTNNVMVDNHDVEVYVGVVADWATRTIDIEVEQFIADQATYESALEDSLTDGFEELIRPEIEIGDYEYDYYYYYDAYTAPYADYYDYDLDIANPIADGQFDGII